MKQLIITSLLLISLNACQYFKQNDLKHGNQAQGIEVIKTYYDNGNMKTVDSFLNGKKNGCCVEFLENGHVVRKAYYRNGKYLVGRDYDSLTGRKLDDVMKIQIEGKHDTVQLGEKYEARFYLPFPIKGAFFTLGSSELITKRILYGADFHGEYNLIGHDSMGGQLTYCPKKKGKFYYVIGMQSTTNRKDGHPDILLEDVDSFVVK